MKTGEVTHKVKVPSNTYLISVDIKFYPVVIIKKGEQNDMDLFNIYLNNKFKLL